MLEQKIENLKLQAALQQQKKDLVYLSNQQRLTAEPELTTPQPKNKVKQVLDKSKLTSDYEYYDEEADSNASRIHELEIMSKNKGLFQKQMGSEVISKQGKRKPL